MASLGTFAISGAMAAAIFEAACWATRAFSCPMSVAALTSRSSVSIGSRAAEMRPWLTRRRAFSITAMSACASNGLLMASMAPVCCTKWSRMRSDFALISTTGSIAKRSLLRMARQNWKPFIFGITKSTSTRSNSGPRSLCRAAARASRAPAVGGGDGLEAVALEHAADDLADGRAVVDDEDAGAIP